PAQVAQELVFAPVFEKRLQAGEPGPLATRKWRPFVDELAAQVLTPSLADGSVSFKYQAIRVEARMAAGACGVRPVLLQRLPERPIAHLPFILWQLGDRRRRRRDDLTQQAAHHPEAPLHRTGSEPRRVPGH